VNSGDNHSFNLALRAHGLADVATTNDAYLRLRHSFKRKISPGLTRMYAD
jgi:hypothetical protein